MYVNTYITLQSSESSSGFFTVGVPFVAIKYNAYTGLSSIRHNCRIGGVNNTNLYFDVTKSTIMPYQKPTTMTSLSAKMMTLITLLLL